MERAQRTGFSKSLYHANDGYISSQDRGGFMEHGGGKILGINHAARVVFLVVGLSWLSLPRLGLFELMLTRHVTL